MLKLSLIFVLLFFSLAFANLQCDLCKLVIGAAENDVKNDSDVKNKIGEIFLNGCSQIADSDTRSSCQVIFSKENFPLFASNAADAIGFTAEYICKGIRQC